MGYMEIFFKIYRKPYSIYLKGIEGLQLRVEDLELGGENLGFSIWGLGLRAYGT